MDKRCRMIRSPPSKLRGEHIIGLTKRLGGAPNKIRLLVGYLGFDQDHGLRKFLEDRNFARRIDEHLAKAFQLDLVRFGRISAGQVHLIQAYVLDRQRESAQAAATGN